MGPQPTNPRDRPIENNQVNDPISTGEQKRKNYGVLVVDDEHSVGIMVQLGLERDGFNVWVASNGREALKLYQAHRGEIAVALLDIGMLGLDGPQILDSLRQQDPTLPACFMTNGLCGYEPEELVKRGGTRMIAKPFRLTELSHLVQLLAQEGRVHSKKTGRVASNAGSVANPLPCNFSV